MPSFAGTVDHVRVVFQCIYIWRLKRSGNDRYLGTPSFESAGTNEVLLQVLHVHTYVERDKWRTRLGERRAKKGSGAENKCNGERTRTTW